MAVTKENLCSGIGSVVVNSANIGGTRGGLTLVRESEYFDVDNIDQLRGLLLRKRMKEVYSVKFEMAEATLENLKRALELESSISEGPPRSLTFGGDTDAAEVTLEFYGTAPGGYQRKVTLHKCRLDAGEVPFKIDDLTVIPVTATCLNDTDKAEGAQIGTVEDSTS